MRLPDAKAGIVFNMYAFALHNGIMLSSGHSQTTGGEKLWVKLENDPRFIVWAEDRQGNRTQVQDIGGELDGDLFGTKDSLRIPIDDPVEHRDNDEADYVRYYAVKR
jgi:hypothetical protein